MADPDLLFADSFDAAPVGMQILRLADWEDPGSFYPVAVNKAACEVLNQDLTEFIGKTWNEFAPELAKSDFGPMFRQALEFREPVTWEVEYGDSLFEKNWWKGTATAIDGRTVVIVFESVTAEKRAKLELERSNRELDDFAYIASHDLRSPLRDMKNLASWIEKDLVDASDEVMGNIAKLRQRVSRMDTLLADLLDYSRAGRDFAKAQTFSLGEVFNNIKPLLAERPGFEVVFPDGDLELQAPRQPLETIIRNLVGNGIKHHPRDDGTVTVTFEEHQTHVTISVTDDGNGIPKEFEDKIFGMFQTLRPRDELEGSGMGLALSRKLAESYGHSLQIDTGWTSGARFTVTWPKNWQLVQTPPERT